MPFGAAETSTADMPESSVQSPFLRFDTDFRTFQKIPKWIAQCKGNTMWGALRPQCGYGPEKEAAQSVPALVNRTERPCHGHRNNCFLAAFCSIRRTEQPCALPFSIYNL
jgi:hypothetical protein